jgi:hypothetical protein
VQYTQGTYGPITFVEGQLTSTFIGSHMASVSVLDATDLTATYTFVIVITDVAAE